MEQLWEILNSPLVGILWKFSTLGYLFAAVVAIHLLRKHLAQNERMLNAIQEIQGDTRMLMESKQDHGTRITTIENRMWEERTGKRNRRDG